MRRLLKRQYVRPIRTMFGTQVAAAPRRPTTRRSTASTPSALGSFSLSRLGRERVRDLGEERRRGRDEESAADPGPSRLRLGPDRRRVPPELRLGFGRIAFRRPLTETETTRYVSISLTARAISMISTRDQHVITAFLQSPNFIYMVEAGERSIRGGSRSPTTSSLRGCRTSCSIRRPTSAARSRQRPRAELGRADHFVASAMLERLDARSALSELLLRALSAARSRLDTGDPAVFPAYNPSLAEA
jgi:hypothetical protein